MIRLQPRDLAEQEEETKKAKQAVVESFVLFFVTVAIIKSG
jgi:hypothetical protein